MYRYKEIYITAYCRARRNRMIRFTMRANCRASCRRKSGDCRRSVTCVRWSTAFCCYLCGVLADFCASANGRRRSASFARRRINARNNMHRGVRFIARASSRSNGCRQAADGAWLGQYQRAQRYGERTSRRSSRGSSRGGDCSVQDIRAFRLVARCTNCAFCNVLLTCRRCAIACLGCRVKVNGRIRAQAISANCVCAMRTTRIRTSRFLTVSFEFDSRSATKGRQDILFFPICICFFSSGNNCHFNVFFKACSRRLISCIRCYFVVKSASIPLITCTQACGQTSRGVLCLRRNLSKG